MQLLFLIVAGVGAGYMLTAQRRCDVFALAFAGACVYFLPGFFGSVPGGFRDELPVPIEAETYAIMTTVLGAILFGAWSWDVGGSQKLKEEPIRIDGLSSSTALMLSVASLFFALWIGGPRLLSAYKEDVLDGASRFFMLTGVGAALSAALAFAQRRWTVLFLATGVLLFTVYVGHRSYFVMAIIAIFLLHLQRQGPQRLYIRNFTAIIAAAGLVMSVFVYKCLYVLVKLGDYSEVFSRLTDSDFYLDAVISSEPFTTQLVLNEVVHTGFETDMDYIFYSVVGQFTLFSGEAGLVFRSFNGYFQPVLFPDVEWGMANNIWAQMIAAGGWPLFLAFLGGFVWTLRLAARRMATARATSRCGVALATAYWGFYIHRNDLGYELSELKRVLLVWVVVAIVSSLGKKTQEAPAAAPQEKPADRPRPRLRAA
jgi:hypothetical protein